MKCPGCKGETVFVDNGREIGTYYFCRVCKKEPKEFKKAELVGVTAAAALKSLGEINNFYDTTVKVSADTDFPGLNAWVRLEGYRLEYETNLRGGTLVAVRPDPTMLATLPYMMRDKIEHVALCAGLRAAADPLKMDTSLASSLDHFLRTAVYPIAAIP